jgi:hypothetical protein
LEAGIFLRPFFSLFYRVELSIEMHRSKNAGPRNVNNPAGASSNLLSADLTAAITAPRFGC